MKQASNSFTKGLMLDIHPSAVQNTQLTDALNATMITYNGNEMMLQNDMGNTLIQDSKTGHIMGLSEGFVPVGLKEHGGIMYIVSANKDGVGEIGTIPSPILKLELRKEELSSTEVQVTTNAGPVSTMVGITDFKVYPGEKFLPALSLENIVDYTVPSKFIIQNIESKPTTDITLEKRLISTIDEGRGCSHNGLYELKLFSIYGSQVTELQNVQKKPMQPFFKNGKQATQNKYWYYPGAIDDSVDIEKTWLNKGFHTYPGNLPPGRLAIKAQLESIDSFDLPKISQSKYSKQNETKAPYIEKSGDEYKLYFPGFEYKTKSIRFIGELEITLTNQTSGVEKCHETLSSFATVDVDGNQYYYQIQPTGQGDYKKISTISSRPITVTDYFTPLLEVNIGKELNAWYRLEVQYTDIYGGYIDTFVHSFNPYHILNFDESYYGIEWKADTLKMQKANIESSASSFSGGETVSFDSDNYYNKGSKWQATFTGNWESHYTVDDQGYVEISTGDFSVSQPSDSTKSKSMKPVYTKYLYGDTNLTQGSGTLKDYQYFMTTAAPTEQFEADNILVQDIPSGFAQLGNTDNFIYGSNFWNQGSHKKYLPFYFNTENPIIKYNLPIDAPALQGPCTFYVGDVGESDDKVFTGNITMTAKFGAPVQKNDNGYWVYAESGKLTYYTDDAHELDASRVIFQYKVPNQSIYSLIPSFSLVGDTDEKLSLRLGLDRTGQPKEALTFGQNLYQTCMPDKSITLTSSFEKSAKCYAQGIEDANGQTTNGVGSNLILDAGVYLITVDAGVLNACKKFYSQDNKEPSDVHKYGCNTNWESTQHWQGEGKQYTKNEDPRIAVVIQNTYYQIARVDSMINSTIRRTFMPTLLYLPKQSIIRMEWKYIEKLQGIGIFRVTKPVVFNNGDWFNDGDDIRIMYYQHPDLREIILPLEATYQEYAQGLDRTYEYYPGMQSLSSINHHINMSATGVKFCQAPNREGTWNYNNTDPTYIWDPYGTGLMEFVYQYWQDNHTQSTEIPKVDSKQSNRLEYRKLNTTT